MIGFYLGVEYRRRPLSAVFTHIKNRGLKYFVYDDGRPTGDYFETKMEMKDWVLSARKSKIIKGINKKWMN